MWKGFPVAQTVKHLPAMWETWVQSLGWQDPLKKEMATHPSTLAWKIPRTEEPGRLQSMESQRVRNDWATSLMVCGILVPQPGMEPVPPTVEAWSLNHWTVREAPGPRLYSTCAPASEEQSCCPQVAHKLPWWGLLITSPLVQKYGCEDPIAIVCFIVFKQWSYI